MKIISVFLAFIIFCAVAFSADATGPSAGLKINVLQMQYEKIACRADFYIATLDSAKNSELNIAVDEMIFSINTHKIALKFAADSGDRTAFEAALKSLKADVQNIVKTYNGAKKSFPRGSAGKKISEKLKSDFQDNKQKRDSCIETASINLGKAQRDYVAGWKSNAEETVSKLKAKGIDTTKMESVLSEVDGIVSKMDDAINSDNKAEIEKTAKEIREEHLHIWARFQIARLDGLLSSMEPKATEKGLTSQVNEIKTLLNNAEAKVKVGQSYNENEFQDVHTNLKIAMNKLVNLFNAIKD